MLCLFFYGLLFSPRNVKISTFSNIFLKSYFFVVLLQPFFKDNKQYEEENSSCYPHPPGLDRNNQVSFPTNKLERLS